MAPELWSADEVAKRLNVTPQTVYRWAKDGVLPAMHLGPRILRFDPAVVEDMVTPLPEEPEQLRLFEASSEEQPEDEGRLFAEKDAAFQAFIDAVAERVAEKLAG